MTNPYVKTGLGILGGGIRGILPCMALVKLEKLTGKLTRDCFHFCGGTSTGALLTAAVAAGIPASDLLKIYTERSREIFRPTGEIARIKRFAMGFMYEPEDLKKVLVSAFQTKSDWTINQSPIPVCISATAMNGHNWYFVRDTGVNSKTTGNVKLIDAAIASACAPTYHDHWKIAIGDRDIRFFDGGVGGVANPGYQICVEMFEYENFYPGTTRLISLGTGYYPQSDNPPSGLVELISWTIGTLVDSSEDWVDAAVNRQWPGVLQKFNIALPRAIDESDLDSIPDLIKIGEQFADSVNWADLLAR